MLIFEYIYSTGIRDGHPSMHYSIGLDVEESVTDAEKLLYGFVGREV